MPRRQKTYHYIYKTTCLVTGKFYVGMHSTDDLENGYLGSGKILGYSRKKYGDENHHRDIIEMCPSREALKLREREIVNEEMLADPLNINLKYGGEGGWDHIDFTPFKNVTIQTEMQRRGNEKIKMLWKEDEFANKTRAKISSSLKGKQSFVGHKHTDETRRKISAKASTRIGSLNSQFGTCWVVKNHVAVKIRKQQLDEYIGLGYSRGRK